METVTRLHRHHRDLGRRERRIETVSEKSSELVGTSSQAHKAHMSPIEPP